MLQNKYNLKITSNEYNNFGNGWGLYVDIEKIKYNFPPNHEILRKKYDLHYNNNNCFENCNDCCCVTTIDIDMPVENNVSIQTRLLQFITRIIPTAIMVFIISYVIIFVI
jgi:hypothetical protein